MVARIVELSFIIDLCNSVMATVGHFLNTHLVDVESVHGEVVVTGSLNVVLIEDDTWQIYNQTGIGIASS